MTDRASQIIAELDLCQPAQLSGDQIVSMYIPVASVGNILAYAIAMRRTIADLRYDLDRLRDELERERAPK